MKFCKDCKHYQHNEQWTNALCTKAEYVGRNVINGEPDSTACYMMRASLNKCGMDAKGFEPKETVPA